MQIHSAIADLRAHAAQLSAADLVRRLAEKSGLLVDLRAAVRDLDAAVEQVRESRRRIVVAADAERRRIARDLDIVLLDALAPFGSDRLLPRGLLREPPSIMASALLDTNLTPLPPEADLFQVSRYFATYNLVAMPVVDEQDRLLGAVTVDDVIDHMLPDDWRGDQMDEFEASEVSGG